MILKLSLNTQMIWMIFMKILKNTIQTKTAKFFIVFNYMIVMIVLSNEKVNPIVTKLFIIGRQLNVSPVFITLSYFAAPENN